MHPVTDPATKAHPEAVQALSEWSKYPLHSEQDREHRVSYVRRELARLESEGVSPLYAAVTFPLSDQQDDAFRALREDNRLFALRLVSGCTPPSTDSQGRELPEAERGKVLAAKIGQRTFSDATVRAAVGYRGGDLHAHRKITERPALLPLEEAIVVMRQWGYRVRPKRANRPGQPPRRDEWLVVHVSDDGTPIGPTETASTEAAPSYSRRRAG